MGWRGADRSSDLIYPHKQREALYGHEPDPFTVKGDAKMDAALAEWIAENPCGMLDVTFV